MQDFIPKMFALWFPIVLICTPMLIALMIGTKPHPHYTAAEQRQESRKLKTRLFLGTLGALIVHLSVWSTPLPWALKTLSCSLFIPLWFFLSVPLIQAKDPGWMTAPSIQGSVRVADLQKRHVSTTAYWRFFGIVFVVMIALIGAAIPFVPEPLRLLELPNVLFLIGSLFFLGMGLVICRLLVSEPEPYMENTFEEQQSEYLKFRKTNIMLALMLFSSAALALVIVALISLAQENQTALLAWGGAVLGIVLGLLGSGWGTWSSFKRAKLNRMMIQDHSPDSA